MTDKANIVLDASKVDLFETCPKRYYFRHIMNRSLPLTHKPSGRNALDLGTLAHEGLGVYYTMLGEGIKYSERIEACLMKIREISSDPEQSNSSMEDVSILLRAVEDNCDYWRAEDENCLEILSVETPFAYILFEDDFVCIIISGKIDLLVNYTGIGRNANY